ncbi:MAG TPA: T9SS type A sorting domain-containing protein [Bacteroidaceae bacterium]|nr:T9SS type A sorting domain-containing protein [Bacteroidaceae bacterium]
MKKTILFCLSLLPVSVIYPQNIERDLISSAGLHSVGTSFRIEWTIGEIITESFISESYMLTQGFHQDLFPVWQIPDTLKINDLIFSEPTDTCFSAKKTILVAGNGTFFIVENGASANLVAGNNIVFMQGTLVQHGGSLLAYITTDSTYCSKPQALVAVNSPQHDADVYLSDAKHLDELLMVPTNMGIMKCRVYPNPTTGVFRLEFPETSNEQKMVTEIISPFGERLLQTECFAGSTYHFDISGMPSGIYFLRAFTENQSMVIKIIKM